VQPRADLLVRQPHAHELARHLRRVAGRGGAFGAVLQGGPGGRQAGWMQQTAALLALTQGALTV
jgi:hypothetical protein